MINTDIEQLEGECVLAKVISHSNLRCRPGMTPVGKVFYFEVRPWCSENIAPTGKPYLKHLGTRLYPAPKSRVAFASFTTEKWIFPEAVEVIRIVPAADASKPARLMSLDD